MKRLEIGCRGLLMLFASGTVCGPFIVILYLWRLCSTDAIHDPRFGWLWVRLHFYPTLGIVLLRHAWSPQTYRLFDMILDCPKHGKLGLGMMPLWFLLPLLEHAGMRSYVTLNEDWEMEWTGIRHLPNHCSLPTRDMIDGPSAADVDRGVAFLETHVKDGVYVHCKGGRGRSPSLVACYLVYLAYQNYKTSPNDFSPEKAVEQVWTTIRSKRPNINPGRTQCEVVLQYAHRLLSSFRAKEAHRRVKS